MPILKMGSQAAKVIYKDHYYLLLAHEAYEVPSDMVKIVTEKTSNVSFLDNAYVKAFNAKLVAECEEKKIKPIKPSQGAKIQKEIVKEKVEAIKGNEDKKKKIKKK